MGVIKTFEALRLAQDQGLDLIEVSASAKPPVCKIADYNKFLYEQKSKAKKTKIKKAELKEFKLGPAIGDGDLSIRIARGKEFLLDGNVVKYTVVFKGGEKAHPEVGFTKLKIVESELMECGKIEKLPAYQGGIMSMTLTPKSKKTS